jgi:hypothetical protein
MVVVLVRQNWSPHRAVIRWCGMVMYERMTFVGRPVCVLNFSLTTILSAHIASQYFRAEEGLANLVSFRILNLIPASHKVLDKAVDSI